MSEQYMLDYLLSVELDTPGQIDLQVTVKSWFGLLGTYKTGFGWAFRPQPQVWRIIDRHAREK